MKKQFEGPLFIVGMSRSGTKLLRDILNNNPQINIPVTESHFIPYLLTKFQKKPFLNDKDLEKLHQIIKNSIFYNELKKKMPGFNGVDFRELKEPMNIQRAIEFTFRSLGEKNKMNARIWGDKTPNNLTSITLLKEKYPAAKFIHIIRDPRERALSAQKAWSANIYLSADRWSKNIDKAHSQGVKVGRDYIEIYYEELIKNPEKEMKKLCSFIGIKYSRSMLVLKRPVENHTTADNKSRFSTAIIKNNKAKYLKEFSSRQIMRIEEISSKTGKRLGYIDRARKEKSLSGVQILFYRLSDQVTSTTYHIKRWGLIDGVRYSINRKKIANIK